MKLAVPSNPKFTITRTGLHIHADLSFEEWAGLAPLAGEMVACAAFLIGDWLVYGQDHFERQLPLPGFELPAKGRVNRSTYDAALAATSLDFTTLQNYAYVARRVPRELRQDKLPWEHHRIVAKLPEPEQKRWLEIAIKHQTKGRALSSRRLRRSIQAGRLLRIEELRVPEADRGIKTHLMGVNRILAWWDGLQQDDWLEEATAEQRAAVKRDLQPVIDIYNLL